MSVYEITLIDPTGPGRPAERVLRITSVDEMVFLSIDEYDEGNPTITLTKKEEIAVSLPGLREALDLLARDGHREDMRERDQHGPKARIGGYRATVVPL
jgi:hypothetical protein